MIEVCFWALANHLMFTEKIYTLNLRAWCIVGFGDEIFCLTCNRSIKIIQRTTQTYIKEGHYIDLFFACCDVIDYTKYEKFAF